MVNTPFNKDAQYKGNLKYPQCYIYEGRMYVISINAKGFIFDYCLDTATEEYVPSDKLVIPVEIDIHIVGVDYENK